MFAVIYISVALLQFSFCQDLSENASQEEDTISYPSEYREDIIQSIQSKLVEVDGDEMTADEIPLSDDNNGGENIVALTQLVTVMDPVKTEDSNNGSLDEDIAPKNGDDDEAVSKNTIRLSCPVKAGGKVTIIAHFGCEEDSNEKLPEESHEPISVSGCAKAQGKVSIAAHYGCDGHSTNFVTSPETGDKPVDEVVPDGPSFGGPVHAQGKISIGTHYGCGAPVGIPPMFSPLPWFPTFCPTYYSSLSLPTYSFPGSFVVQYPIPGTGHTSPVYQDPHTFKDPSFEDTREYLPVASTLENFNDGNGKDNHHGMAFNGELSASGTVSIAARF